LVEGWLNAQAASGYVTYDAGTGAYQLLAAHAVCLTDESSPAFLLLYLMIASVLHKDEERVAQVFTGGAALPWGEHHPALYRAFARSAAADYADLVTVWVPALDGVEDKLRSGARVVDIGCGEGAPTLMLADAFPASTFAGFDANADAIATARKAAARAGLANRVMFETAWADATPGRGYDLVCTFDAIHDMGDPVAVARHVKNILAPGGVWMIVDRNAADSVSDNFHVVGRLSYSASCFLCVPSALAQGAADALGAQAGQAKLRQVALDAGFTNVRRAAESPFNLVLEVRS
jgi:2-polyprenyl-3-methyl-5-hydroxy-6-metoxy-1,4-benzoquinol methylase